MVGVTGSVAAIEIPKLIRELRRRGADVVCVISPSAMQIIGPRMLEWASGKEVITGITGKTEHVLWCSGENKADLFLIAPATANTISKIACAIDDTPITTFAMVAIPSKMPILMVPTMERSMYNHPVLVEHIIKLKGLGVGFVEPIIAEEKAKFPPVNSVVACIDAFLTVKSLRGKRVVVTAGPTVEDIDPVRFISNRSSGRLGVAIAEQAFARGANVELLIGFGGRVPVLPLRHRWFTNTKNLQGLLEKVVPTADIVIHAAAVSDFTLTSRETKLRSDVVPDLVLQKTPKLLDLIKQWEPKATVVGFKAAWGVSEDQLVAAAEEIIRRTDIAVVVANDIVRVGFGTDDSEVILVKKDGQKIKIPRTSKHEIACAILDLL